MSAETRFRRVPAAQLLAALADHTEQELKLFRESWEDLPVDRYLPDVGDYRRRRYGRFAGVERMTEQSGATFCQTSEVNALNGGVPRDFPPLSAELTRPGGVLRSLVRELADLLPGPFDRDRGGVGVHQVRITAGRGGRGLPTPEGVHEDGHHFVAQVFLGRHGVAGGVSRIYDRERRPLLATTLTEPFEALVIDDRRVYHSVDPIEPAAGYDRGGRDMLLVDFFPLDDGSRAHV